MLVIQENETQRGPGPQLVRRSWGRGRTPWGREQAAASRGHGGGRTSPGPSRVPDSQPTLSSLPTIPPAPPSGLPGTSGEIKGLQSKAPGHAVSSLKPVSLPQGLPSGGLWVHFPAAQEAAGLSVEWESDLRLLRALLGRGRGPQAPHGCSLEGRSKVLTAARTKSVDF